MFPRQWVLLAVAASAVFGCTELPSNSDVELASHRAPPTPEQEAVVAISEALSVPPEVCVELDLEKAFRRGEVVGKVLVGALWRRYGACSMVEQFTDQLLMRLDEVAPDAEPRRPRRRCRYAGVMEGIFGALEAIQQQCASSCFMDGDFVGAIEAKAYCDLAIEAAGDLDPAPWLRAAVGVCGFEFEVACDTRFLVGTQGYSNGQGRCEPYTRDPYREIWDRSRLKSCDYYQNTNP